MKLFQCNICSKNFPELYMHTHHKIPRLIGGPDTDENLKKLCPGCHDALHNLAYKMLNPKASTSQAIDALHFIYHDNKGAINLCIEYASLVRDSMVKVREKGTDPDQIVSVATSMRKRHKDILNLRCKEIKLSQEAYLRNLILIDLHKRYPAAGINPVEEHHLVRQLKRKK